MSISLVQVGARQAFYLELDLADFHRHPNLNNQHHHPAGNLTCHIVVEI